MNMLIYLFHIYRLFKQGILEFRQNFFGKMALSRMRSTQILLVCVLNLFIVKDYVILMAENTF